MHLKKLMTRGLNNVTLILNIGKWLLTQPAIMEYLTKDDKPVLNFNFQVNISSEIIFDFNYSTDYFIGGDVTYPTTLQPEKMKYFSIKIIKQGKLY